MESNKSPFLRKDHTDKNEKNSERSKGNYNWEGLTSFMKLSQENFLEYNRVTWKL